MRAAVGSLTPHLCSDTCAGTLTGRQNTPPIFVDGDLTNVVLLNNF
jgi:hypothetical protein